MSFSTVLLERQSLSNTLDHHASLIRSERKALIAHYKINVNDFVLVFVRYDHRLVGDIVDSVREVDLHDLARPHDLRYMWIMLIFRKLCSALRSGHTY